MEKLLIAMILTLSALPSWAGPSYQLDGISIGQPSSQLRWLEKSNGKFRHGQTTVEVKNGEVITIWGQKLVTPSAREIKLGQSGESALKILGKPNGNTLYGCGRTSQQIHFYQSEGLDLTVTDQKVTAIRLYKKP